jgi:hypothetical protein
MRRVLRHRIRRRIGRGVLVCAAALGTLAALVVHPAETDASWTSQQQSTASVSSGTVAPPVVSGCAGTALSTAVTIKWSLPPSGQYATADIAFGVTKTGLGTATEALGATTSATTGPVGGVYTTTLSSTLLSGLLGSILGQTIYISLWTMYKPSVGVTSTWVSSPVGYKVTYPAVLGALGGSCSAP